jgi:thioredoxin reductase
MNDVIIIGGSFAGLAAALQLGRARRKVIVLDTGLPRNRFAGHSHALKKRGVTAESLLIRGAKAAPAKVVKATKKAPAKKARAKK